jgi:hypothetical protein
MRADVGVAIWSTSLRSSCESSPAHRRDLPHLDRVPVQPRQDAMEPGRIAAVDPSRPTRPSSASDGRLSRASFTSTGSAAVIGLRQIAEIN